MLTTDRESYAAGSEVSLILNNDSQHEVGYNLCTATLQVESDGAWRASEVQAEQICTAILHIMAPGERDSFTHTLDARLPPGRYRYATQLELVGPGTRGEHYSTAFSVTSR